MKTASLKRRLLHLRAEGVRRPGKVVRTFMGREMQFQAYDRGNDTLVFENDVWAHVDERASVLFARKRDLGVGGARGHVVTFTTGNHAVAAMPLLGGELWNLCRIPSSRRSEVMSGSVLCANVVAGRIEVSQRDVPCKLLVEIDEWLRGDMGFAPEDVVFADRNEETLDHFRTLGEEWRVKPLVWSEREMRAALDSSRKTIGISLRYYHSSRGVHFLSYTDFHAFVARAAEDPSAFRAQLCELASRFEECDTSLLRQPKFRGHHEVELFGIPPGVAEERLLPALEKLAAEVCKPCRGAAPLAVSQLKALAAADSLYKSLLASPEFADDTSREFTESMYAHLAGAVYAISNDGGAPAFDQRRTALPGATFVDGVPSYHSGCDARSEILLSNLRGLLSKGEKLEYANVYELRSEDPAAAAIPTGSGKTREIVYKTNLGPTTRALVEKRLSHPGAGYGEYVLARIAAMKALGVSLAEYKLLRRRATRRRGVYDFYIRTRCEGDPLWRLPANLFRAGERARTDEDAHVVRALAGYIGDAAAQNMAMKKYDPVAKSCLFGVGKEIYRFSYDIKTGRQMPSGVSICSVRGSFGWPDVSCTEENFEACAKFYASAYAKTLHRFAKAHSAVPREELAAAFLDGFEHRSRAMAWEYRRQHDAFESFAPTLPSTYDFHRKWRFVLWSLLEQSRAVDAMKTAIFENIQLP